ncbi:MAG: hypothetical protein CL793_06305 [Chloroflexi bacterium]|nr:hypothetical protein [Chloroflexota bacterium]|tara:strand:- start:4765 stop:5169 length:405 start_codon:yes stop_codon:yes gene_type:complete
MTEKKNSLSLSFSIGGETYQTDEDDHSVALFVTGDGCKSIAPLAVLFIREYWDKRRVPIPQTMLVDFIVFLVADHGIHHSRLKLFPSTMYGPETNMGHFVFHTTGSAIEHYTDTPWPDLIHHKDVLVIEDDSHK